MLLRRYCNSLLDTNTCLPDGKDQDEEATSPADLAATHVEAVTPADLATTHVEAVTPVDLASLPTSDHFDPSIIGDDLSHILVAGGAAAKTATTGAAIGSTLGPVGTVAGAAIAGVCAIACAFIAKNFSSSETSNNYYIITGDGGTHTE